MDLSNFDPNDSSGWTLEILMRRQYGDKAVDQRKAECEAKGMTIRELIEMTIKQAMDEAAEGC